MTKQEIMIDYADFLATVLEGKGPEKLPVEGPLIDAYLYSSVLAYLRPDWFQSKKFDPAFSDLCRQLSDYQEKAGRDVFFSSIAKHSKIVTESETCKSFDVGKVRYCVELNSGVVPSQDIGLLISKEPKDRKFAMRTMAKFLRRAFPKPKEALMVLSTPKPKPAMVLLTDRINSVLSPAVQYPELPTTGILPMSELPFQQLNTGEKRDFMHEMWRYITMLMPETPYSDAILPKNMRWSYVDGEKTKEVDINSRFAREAACLNPEPLVCYLCRPEFRRLLSAIFYVRSSQLPVAPLYSKGSEERARYFALHDSVLAPIMEGMDEAIRYQVDMAGDALMGQEKMKIQLDEAEQEVKDLRAQLDEMSKRTAAPELEQELSKLKEELTAVRRKSETDLERVNANLSRLQGENKRLTENLKASQASYNEINEQYINLLWEDGMFLDEDDLQEQDAPPARQASCLNPSFMAVASCQPRFQELMSTIFYVRSSGLEIEPMTRRVDRRKERYFEAARETVLPAVRAFNEARAENAKLTNATARLSKALMAEKDAHAKDMDSMEQAIGEERRETKRASAYNEEVSAMKEEVAKARKKADSAAIDLERTKAALSKVQEENKRLSATVSEGRAAFNEINSQLISMIEEQDLFLDDEDLLEQDAPPAPTGVRDRIGEDAYQKLSDKKLVIVGGHSNTQRVLRELFPEWRFFAVNEWLPDTLSSADAVVILSKYVSHKSYEQAKSVVKGTGIPMLLVNFNGPSSICRSLAEQIF